MKAYLHYNVYFEVELPNINPNTIPWQQAVMDLREYVESELLGSEDLIVAFEDVIEG